MAETYEAKLSRRLRLRAKFPHPLDLVAIRHVDRIAALSDDHKQILGKAISENLRSIPLALERLEALGEDATVEFLLEDNKNKATQQAVDAGDVETLMDVMTDCFPGTPVLTIRSLAQSAVMAGVVQTIRALREAVQSENFKSDFVATTLYAVIKYGKKTLEDRIKTTPSLIQVIKQSGLTWDGD